MDQAENEELITLDDTASDSVVCVTDSLNGSKRKATDDDSDGVIESARVSKRLCQEAEDSKPSDSQIITVIFQSQDIASKYSKEIIDYIGQLTKSDITTSVERDGKSCLEFYKNSGELGNADDAIHSVGTQKAISVDSVPQYDQTFSGTIGVRKREVKVADKAPKPKNVCFNCDGDHMIAACPEPRDTARIAKNRRVRAERNPVYNRYHEEADQKFGHLAPGQISAGLREALGLRGDELPLHTYRMRVQGYPPGWLRAARQQRSNISVHHEPAAESDKDVSKSDEREEEHYDVNKLISFPGFNVACTDGCRDDFKRNGFPPMQKYWSLHVMRRRLKRAPARRASLARSRPADLPSSARDAAAPPGQDGAGSQAADTEATTNGNKEGSPTLEALEEQRRALLDSLDEPAEEGEDGELEEDEDEDEPPQEEVSELVHAPPVASSTPQTPVLTPGASRRRELGTPVAASREHIVYDAGKWSAGITEHIPYENLPGATGAWDRMSGLMKRIRDQLTGKN